MLNLGGVLGVVVSGTPDVGKPLLCEVLGAVELDVHTLLYAATAIVVGFQAVAFALFTKVFAVSEGLLPDDPWVTRVTRLPTLEVGLACGAALLLAGTAGSLYAVGVWGGEAFGPLEPTRMLRVVIPSVAAGTRGAAVVLAGVVLSVLGLRRR